MTNQSVSDPHGLITQTSPESAGLVPLNLLTSWCPAPIDLTSQSGIHENHSFNGRYHICYHMTYE